MVFYLILFFSLPTYISRSMVALTETDFCKALSEPVDGTPKGFQVNLSKGTLKPAHCKFTTPKVVVDK